MTSCSTKEKTPFLTAISTEYWQPSVPTGQVRIPIVLSVIRLSVKVERGGLLAAPSFLPLVFARIVSRVLSNSVSLISALPDKGFREIPPRQKMDTIRFKIFGVWPDTEKPMTGWEFTTAGAPADWKRGGSNKKIPANISRDDKLQLLEIIAAESRKTKPRMRHTESGLRILGNTKPQYVECSLPRLLWGNNARVITSQQELDEALMRLHDLLRSVLGSYSRGRFMRVDMAFMLPLSVAKTQSLMKLSGKHPHFRKSRNRKVQKRRAPDWGRKGTNASVSAYSKAMQMGFADDGMTRCELKLKGQLLNRFLAVDEREKEHGLLTLNFEKCFETWQHFFAGFKRLQPHVPDYPATYQLPETTSF